MLYATPYDINYQGFYFSDIDEFNTLYQQHPCEEFEIQFIDGDNSKLFVSAQIDQGSLVTWFNELSDISDDDDKSIQIQYLLGAGYTLEEAISRCDEVCLFHGTACDYAYDLFSEFHEIPEYLINYIDYDKIANDLILNGEISEHSHHIFIVNSNEI